MSVTVHELNISHIHKVTKHCNYPVPRHTWTGWEIIPFISNPFTVQIHMIDILCLDSQDCFLYKVCALPIDSWKWDSTDFTLSNPRLFYSSTGEGGGGGGGGGRILPSLSSEWLNQSPPLNLSWLIILPEHTLDFAARGQRTGCCVRAVAVGRLSATGSIIICKKTELQCSCILPFWEFSMNEY